MPMRGRDGEASRKRVRRRWLAGCCCVVALAGAGPGLSCAASSSAGRSGNTAGCTLEIAGGDVQEAIDRISSAGRPATLCLAAGEYRLRRFLSLEHDALT